MHSGSIAALVSVLFGLMLADLFSSAHRLLRSRNRVRWHWLPILVSWYVLATVLKNWWALVAMENIDAWSGGWIFLFYGHLLLLLYLVAAATLPDEVPAEGIDLRSFYLENRTQFWGLLSGVYLIMLVFSLLHPAIAGAAIFWPPVISNFLMGAVSVSLAFTRRMAYHCTVVVLMVLLTILELVGKL
ncbi:MAG: hypothetical protein JXA64_01395 [Candidatus Fermentibacteraceae bacterium]|nr:hypothetical protein [Candidatus Fermentibacteraceae bacterium]MBN2607741.1 hypothetical protein [Candidatus Fermentibacteraceae bacterium]